MLLVFAVAACTAAKASPSSVANPASSGQGGTASPYPPTTPSATSTLTYGVASDSPSPSPTPTPFTGPLPTVGPVPAGAWTGINWLQIPTGHTPAVSPGSEYSGFDATIEGWSGGYLDLIWNPVKRTLTPWVSSDGLTWRTGARFDTSAWIGDFRSYDSYAGSSAAAHDDCWFEANHFQEGPAMLLLTGDVDCRGGCARDFWTAQTSWVSSDGSSWTPVTDQPGWWLSGGSSGFISFDPDTGLGVIWTSADGKGWTKGRLPKVPAGSWINSPVAVEGGFVLPGVVMLKKGYQPDGPGTNDGGRRAGCGGMGSTDLSLYQAALWWSPDGQNWTRDTLTGGTTSGYFNGIDMTVDRIDDHSIVAEEYFESTDSVMYWVSKDGRSWTRLKGGPEYLRSDEILVGRDRGLIVGDSIYTARYWPSLLCFNGGSSLVKLQQTGAVPWADMPQMVLGPTGILVTVDGTQFWIGVPN